MMEDDFLFYGIGAAVLGGLAVIGLLGVVAIAVVV